MITLEFTEEEIGTLIAALGDWLEVPGLDPCGTLDDTREWLRRQDAGADLDMDLREALHRQDDEWSNPEDPDLHMDPVDFAAKHDADPSQIVICDAEINAETATSRAAGRRGVRRVRRAAPTRFGAVLPLPRRPPAGRGPHTQAG